MELIINEKSNFYVYATYKESYEVNPSKTKLIGSFVNEEDANIFKNVIENVYYKVTVTDKLMPENITKFVVGLQYAIIDHRGGRYDFPNYIVITDRNDKVISWHYKNNPKNIRKSKISINPQNGRESFTVDISTDDNGKWKRYVMA